MRLGPGSTAILCAVIGGQFLSCGSKRDRSTRAVAFRDADAVRQSSRDALPAAPGAADAGRAVAIAGVPVRPPEGLARAIELKVVATGLRRPVALETPPNEPAPENGGRLFVVEQHRGTVRIVRAGKPTSVPFLNLGKRVSRGNEQGLLGLAFHPQYDSNRKLYVNYTAKSGATHVVEFQASASNSDVVDPKSERELFVLRQPFSNHNGGDLEFGPDGLLYVGTGDGGAGGDPLKAGQSRTALLAKMLRFDVNLAKPKPEIVQIGLRNPWRYCFDSKTGDLYIGDVGQEKYEEVHVVAKDDIQGHNFGWNIMEGRHCYDPPRSCDTKGLTLPVVEYNHSTGCSIAGGEVYRGTKLPELDGMYFYSDLCKPIIRSFRWTAAKVSDHWDWTLPAKPPLADVTSFGVDAQGELYILSLKGVVYRFARRG